MALTITPPINPRTGRRYRARGFLGVFTTAADTIEEAIERAQGIFHDTAEHLLDTTLAAKPKGTPYTVSTDGINRPSRVYIRTAVRQVRIGFPQEMIAIAIRLMREAMRAEISGRRILPPRTVGGNSSRPSAPRTSELRAMLIPSIRIWHGHDGVVDEVTGAEEIKDFKPGDYVAMVPDIPKMPIYNSLASEANSGRGFMARTAARIRRQIRLRKDIGGGIRISAGRSRAIGTRMHIPADPGTRRKRKVPVKPMPADIYANTSPAIFLRWRPSNFNVRGA